MESISKLQVLLTLTKKSETQSYSEYFNEIAELLMNKCVIAKGNVKYEIVEIEFYLYTPDHQDVIAYPRELSAGQWFFHPSGVDLTFESSSDKFGGILIRGIRNVLNENDYVLGPLKCVERLWDTFNAFDNQSHIDYPLITDAGELRSYKISNYPRWIRVPKGKTELDKINEWKKRLPGNTTSSYVSDEDLTKLIFQSKYRFIKLDSIDQSLDCWKKYSAKNSIK